MNLQPSPWGLQWVQGPRGSNHPKWARPRFEIFYVDHYLAIWTNLDDIKMRVEPSGASLGPGPCGFETMKKRVNQHFWYFMLSTFSSHLNQFRQYQNVCLAFHILYERLMSGYQLWASSLHRKVCYTRLYCHGYKKWVYTHIFLVLAGSLVYIFRKYSWFKEYFRHSVVLKYSKRIFLSPEWIS